MFLQFEQNEDQDGDVDDGLLEQNHAYVRKTARKSNEDEIEAEIEKETTRISRKRRTTSRLAGQKRVSFENVTDAKEKESRLSGGVTGNEADGKMDASKTAKVANNEPDSHIEKGIVGDSTRKRGKRQRSSAEKAASAGDTTTEPINTSNRVDVADVECNKEALDSSADQSFQESSIVSSKVGKQTRPRGRSSKVC